MEGIIYSCFMRKYLPHFRFSLKLNVNIRNGRIMLWMKTIFNENLLLVFEQNCCIKVFENKLIIVTYEIPIFSVFNI